jgi:hypothetical protein
MSTNDKKLYIWHELNYNSKTKSYSSKIIIENELINNVRMENKLVINSIKILNCLEI